MTEIAIGDARYRIVPMQDDGGWSAHAERADTGERFGLTTRAKSESEAVERIRRWLEWQHVHTQALAALQEAERAYHRTIAGSAFVGGTEGPTPLELQKEALDRVEAARGRLDEIRAGRPEI